MNWLERGVRNEIGAIKGVDVFGSGGLRCNQGSRGHACCHITVWFKSACFQVTETSLEVAYAKKNISTGFGCPIELKNKGHLVSWEGKLGTGAPSRTQARYLRFFIRASLCLAASPHRGMVSSDAQFP